MVLQGKFDWSQGVVYYFFDDVCDGDQFVMVLFVGLCVEFLVLFIEYKDLFVQIMGIWCGYGKIGIYDVVMWLFEFVVEGCKMR